MIKSNIIKLYQTIHLNISMIGFWHLQVQLRLLLLESKVKDLHSLDWLGHLILFQFSWADFHTWYLECHSNKHHDLHDIIHRCFLSYTYLKRHELQGHQNMPYLGAQERSFQSCDASSAGSRTPSLEFWSFSFWPFTLQHIICAYLWKVD